MEISPNSETKLPVHRRLIQSTLVPHKSQDNVVNVDEDLGPDVDQEDDEEEYCGSQSRVKKNKKRKPKVASQSRASRKIVANGNDIEVKNTEEEDSPATVKCDFFLKVSEKRLQLKQQKEQLPIHSPEDLELDVDHEDGDEEEYNGSQSQVKKNKKRKPKTVSQSKASTKLAVNGNEIEGKNIEEESPVTVKNDFFLKVSERRNQRRQKKEQLPINSPEIIELNCSPSDAITNSKSPRKARRRVSSTPKKRQNSVTPKKEQMNSTPSKNGVLNDDLLEKMLTSPPKSIPDLRLEAKMTAEENSRIFAGKQIHPFFSSWKISKKNTESNGLENKWCHVEGKESNNDFSTFHIFEKTQGQTFTVDWRNWTFSESIFKRTNQEAEDSCLPLINEGSVNCLQFDNFLNAPSLGISLSQNNGSSSQHPIQLESSTLMVIKQESECNQQKDIEVVNENGRTGCFPENTEFVVNSDIQRKETVISESHRPSNSLWTTKYQPEKAIEICGNNESVKFLNAWLHQWREKGSTTNKLDNDNWIMQGVDLNYSPTDSDSESTDEETGLKNVLLVTGPVGSGKSAAIYACAKEQGFQVIEVNTSDWRNGALVKQKFGEAVESHWLKCSVPNPGNTDNKNQLKSYDDVIELIPLSDDEDSKDVKPIEKVNKISSSQNGTKTLILFEDIDATLYEDRGFISTIQQLAETAKRPMILTSNSDDPELPNNLDRIEVNFRIPSSEDLLTLAKMVCDSEKAEINPSLVERFIDYCQGDIRKTIMLLQFWCQGQNRKKFQDNETRNTYAPLLFDTNASHQVLPQMVPPGHTSKLSEIIEKEITKSSLLAEKYDNNIMETIEEEEENDCDSIIEAKKDEMLRKHCSDQDGNNFPVHCITTNELPSCSSSPIAFTKRTLQKKFDPGMSDSGDGGNHGLSDVPEDENEEVIDGRKRLRRKYNSVMSSDSEEEDFCDKNIEDTCQASEIPICSNMNSTWKSVDVSCVPESSYVPETEIENGTCFDGGIEEASMSAEFASRTVRMEFGNLCEEDKVPGMVVSDSGLDTAPGPGEEIGDSNIEPMAGIPREYQMMDECSRIDFNKKPELESESESESTDIVQETWRKLRNCENELRQYVSNEEKDTFEALRISQGMTNLISEADLLLAECQLLTCDYLKPSMVSPEKSHSSSWHDDQLQMASTIGQHGFCLYAKQGSNSQLDLGREMLTASTNAISLGKLINQNNIENKIQKSRVSLKSMLESPLCNTVQSIVPLKSQLSLKGYVFHEYLSTLSQISRSESSRFSEAINNSNQRRKRVARNYLSNGGLSLSIEDISLLDQYSCYQKQKLSENLV